MHIYNPFYFYVLVLFFIIAKRYCNLEAPVRCVPRPGHTHRVQGAGHVLSGRPRFSLPADAAAALTRAGPCHAREVRKKRGRQENSQKNHDVCLRQCRFHLLGLLVHLDSSQLTESSRIHIKIIFLVSTYMLYYLYKYILYIILNWINVLE